VKKSLLAAAICMTLSTATQAGERFIAVTHDTGVTSWWAPMISDSCFAPA